MQEIWRDIPGFEGKYQVSNLGRVKALEWITSFTYKGTPCTRLHEEKMISITESSNQYLNARISQKSFMVHRLVAMAFHPNPENKPQVNHKDGNKYNNHVDNLEWATRQENVDHGYEMGLMHKCKGVRHHKSKLTPTDIINIRFNRQFFRIPHRVLAEFYDVSKTAIRDILTGKNWAHI